MTLPFGVMTVFAWLAVWSVLAVRALRNGRWGPVLICGIALMLFLNIGYLIFGAPASIANFIGIYDVLINLGLGAGDARAAVAACPDNGCTVWGETFTQHPAWGVAFHARFSEGILTRNALLMGHITFNSIAFVLLHVQFLRPGGASASHQLLGRVLFGSVTLGVLCAVLLAAEHGPVAEYGGALSMWGFWSMSAFVYGTLLMGIRAIRAGDAARHRRWMWRFAGAMWGSFWLFRVLLFVIDPIFRDVASLAILICIWGSAPAGILLAEMIRRRLDGRHISDLGEATSTSTA